MPIDAIRNTAFESLAATRASGSVRDENPGASFASILGKAQDLGDEDAQARARKAAQQIVAVALVQPVFKQLRESSSAAPPFAPTQGEKQFRSLMDAELADRIVRSSNFPLVDRIARQMLEHQGGSPLASGGSETSA